MAKKRLYHDWLELLMIPQLGMENGIFPYSILAQQLTQELG